jgi:hypothetical protein
MAHSEMRSSVTAVTDNGTRGGGRPKRRDAVVNRRYSAAMAQPRLALLFCLLCLSFDAARAQVSSEPGRSIGKVSVHGKVIIVELNEGALGKANLFNLTGRTLRFTPQGSGYKIENRPLRWDPDFGPQLGGAQASLHNFAFPFAGRSWQSFLVGTSGSLRFGGSEKDVKPDPYGHAEGGIALDRFDQLADVAQGLSAKAPAISVFLKPRLSGPRYVKELADRVLITWDLTEPYGSLLDFTWFKTVNRFQAVLHSNGSLEMSYKQIAAKDAIVGIYPSPSDRPAPVHFSALSAKSKTVAAPYEAFHYLAMPKPQDLSCTVIRALGDHFDFFAYYSDFRIDSQEASPPSDGPVGGKVSGIGDTMHDQSESILRSRCTKGGFQLGYAAPVFVGSNEMQEGPPPGAAAATNHEIGFYSRQLAEATPDGKVIPYNYAVGHLGHEVGHRWGAYVTAKVNGETIRLGPWPHWAPGLQAPVAFPYSLPTEASTLGGGVWQENHDGTYTRLRDGFFVPATGYSHLDLYLMGLISAAEVPDFFILNNLVLAGTDTNGHSVFKADRMKITIQDVIAAEGPRSPDVEHSQRKFNTGIVVIVEHRHRPSAKLLTQAEGIRRRWIEYWGIATGHRASMMADPR